MKKIATLLAIILITSPAYSYDSVMDTAEINPLKDYKTGLEVQFVTDGNTGKNFTLRAGKNLTEKTSLQIELGGLSSKIIAAHYKWAFHKYKERLSMAAIFTAGYGRYSDSSSQAIKEDEASEDIFTLRVTPLFSQKVLTNSMQWTPYIALPFGFKREFDENIFTSQLTLGSEFHIYELTKSNVSFNAELGFSLIKSPSYLSLGLNYYFDEL